MKTRIPLIGSGQDGRHVHRKVLLRQVITRCLATGLSAAVLVSAATSAQLGQTSDSGAKRASRDDISDQAIVDKIEDELGVDLGVAAARIDVGSVDGIVTLSGFANHVLAKRRAARIAEAVKGVRAVINRIEVDAPKGRSNAAIGDDVKAALLADPATDSYQVTVTVKDGVVALSGTVDSYRESQLAERVAEGVRGVKKVENGVDVNYDYERPDGDIREEIEQSLKWNIRTRADLIDVRVDEGRVTLAGRVGSAAQHRAARVAARVAGVRGVDARKLEVDPTLNDPRLRDKTLAPRSEVEIRAAVRAALLRDPRVQAFDLGVDVAGSVVTLRGEVSTLRAKTTAEKDAHNTVGVAAVANRLKVKPGMTLGDEVLEGKIRKAIDRDPYLERFDTTVAVRNGTAYLYGTVDSPFEKSRATLAASSVQGVFAVENRQQVLDGEIPYVSNPYVDDDDSNSSDIAIGEFARRSPDMSDAQIKNAIEDELWWSPFVDSESITVSVDDGIATLEGTVGSWSERRIAAKNAYDGGATLVDNHIVVE